MKIELLADAPRIRISKTLSILGDALDHRSRKTAPRTAVAAIGGTARGNSFLAAPPARSISSTISTGLRLSKRRRPACCRPATGAAGRCQRRWWSRWNRRSRAASPSSRPKGDTGDTAGWWPVPALGEQTIRGAVRPSAVAAVENGRRQSPARSQAGSGLPTAVISPEAPADSLARALARSMAPAPEFQSTTTARRLTASCGRRKAEEPSGAWIGIPDRLLAGVGRSASDCRTRACALGYRFQRLAGHR